jgi:hypothetical protein
MTQDVVNFLRLQPGVDRHHDQAGLEQAQIDLDQFDGIERSDRDPIARLEPLVQKPVRQAGG